MVLTRFLVLGVALSTGGGSPGEAPPPASGCGLCGGTELLACLRCEGKGRRELPCARCAGERRIPCPVNTCAKGRRRCFACGGGGQILWDSGARDPCLVCAKKGVLDCGLCSGKGSIDCPLCQRAGRRTLSCGACVGTGFHPCPRCPSAACSACEGRGEHDCPRCLGNGGFPLECEECHGYGKVDCEPCFNGRAICEECYGSGRRRLVGSVTGSKAGASKCGPCSGRGYRPCTLCRGGFLECLEQPGRRDCEACERGRRPCLLCRG